MRLPFPFFYVRNPLFEKKGSGTSMETISAIRGFKDILPAEAGQWLFVEEQARRVFHAFGFRDIRIPILEKTELFARGIGESTDIVEKEMYTFTDRGDESLTLRPEATAGVLRAYIEHALHAADPVARLYTIGPMFRRERPQKGRYRQFYQIDAEILGLDDPRVDAELILMLIHFLAAVGLKDPHVEINSLGCPICRPAFRSAVIAHLQGREEMLCGDCRRRIDTNPLRVFDCKIESCREAIAHAPRLADFLCGDCRTHFGIVQESLDLFGVPFAINDRMVRGLDYYTRTTFEVTTDVLGAQNAVVGGGRYDGLVQQLGGPEIPGIGFAIGFERLVSLMPAREDNFRRTPALFIAGLGEAAQKMAWELANRLRLQGIEVEMDYTGKSLKSQMKRADKFGCRFALIIGDREIAEGQGALRDMKNSSQTTVRLDLASIREKMEALQRGVEDLV